MSKPSERIKELINSLNLNVNSFSKECGYNTPSTIWALIKRDQSPTKPTLDKICYRFPQVNREWLMTGYGSMFTKQQDDDLTVTAKQVIDKLENEIKHLKDELKFIRASLLGIEMFHGIDIKTKTIKNKNV